MYLALSRISQFFKPFVIRISRNRENSLKGLKVVCGYNIDQDGKV